jgi:hypothetical protein
LTREVEDANVFGSSNNLDLLNFYLFSNPTVGKLGTA